ETRFLPPPTPSPPVGCRCGLTHPGHSSPTPARPYRTAHPYYREGTIAGDKWLCVVVKYLDNDAFVITAYLTDKLKPIEAPLQHPRSLNVEKPRL
ncbi:MAG: hypothetical protein ACOYM4_15155, partial [Nodosilinea sp.]